MKNPWVVAIAIITMVVIVVAFYHNRWDIATFGYVHLCWLDLKERVS